MHRCLVGFFIALFLRNCYTAMLGFGEFIDDFLGRS